MKTILFSCCLFLVIAMYSACREQQGNLCSFTKAVSVPSEQIILQDMACPVYIGGYGSSMAYNDKDSTFWLLTDRGPNVDGPTPESKIFPLPDYTPHIGIFKPEGDSLKLFRKIFLKDSTGLEFSGLPNTQGDGKTGETAYNLNGQVIRNDKRRGIDPEGLALAPDGTFWVSDEYGPYLMHFDHKGELIEELSPFNGKLPSHYKFRRPNRGMEGLTISTDGQTLYGIMQSPLNEPDGQKTPFSEFIPVLVVNPVTLAYKEYSYALENPENGVSEITYVNDTTFLVLERDSKFPDNGKTFKRIYRIILTPQADITNPVRKELACDLLQAIPGYAHDKPEGMALISNSILSIINDDDFGITASKNSSATVIPKRQKNHLLDKNKLYFIPLQSLYKTPTK
ncbi:MAG: esterase-like activity of phytase family protein [Odoribacter splanchnicus]